MGSGASFDTGLEADHSTRFFCHACRRVFGLGGLVSAQDLYCPHCHSTFLEEISTLAGDAALRARVHADLTEEQSRRLANAATMLRLLESQLRDELEQLQMAYANNARRTEEEKIKPLTTVMREKLRKSELSLDMLCSQPNCPICSEDFSVGTKALQLPCSHLFHDACVMPWLEAKKTCPICRFELTDSVPSMQELLRFSEVEIREKLRGLLVSINDPLNKSKNELAELLHKELISHKEAADVTAREEADALALRQQVEQDRLGSIFGLPGMHGNSSTDSLVSGLGLGSLGMAFGAAIHDAAAAAAASSGVHGDDGDDDRDRDGTLTPGETVLRRERLERELDRERAEHNTRWMLLRDLNGSNDALGMLAGDHDHGSTNDRDRDNDSNDSSNSNNHYRSGNGRSRSRGEQQQQLDQSDREWYRAAGDELDRLLATVDMAAAGVGAATGAAATAVDGSGSSSGGPAARSQNHHGPSSSTSTMTRGRYNDDDVSAANISSLLVSYYNPAADASDEGAPTRGGGRRGPGTMANNTVTPLSMSQQANDSRRRPRTISVTGGNNIDEID